MFYAVGDYDCIGMHVFGIESMLDKDGTVRPEAQTVVDSLRCMRAAAPLLLKYQGTGKVHAIAQEEGHNHQLFDLGGFWGLVQFGADPTDWSWQDWRHGSMTNDAQQRGRGLLFQAGEDEFYMVGAGYRVLFIKKASPAEMLSGVIVNQGALTRLTNNEVVQEGHFDAQGAFVATRHRCGDETDFWRLGAARLWRRAGGDGRLVPRYKCCRSNASR